MKKLFNKLNPFKHNPNKFRNKVSFISPDDRTISGGHLVQYFTIETHKGKVLPEPLIMTMIEPDLEKSHFKSKVHISLPASDIQIL